MNMIEKKVELLLQLAVAEDEAGRRETLEEIRKIRDAGDDAATAYETSDLVERKIEQLLLDIGVPTNLSGYFYLTKAIRIVVENRGICDEMRTKMYPRIAKEMGGDRTPSRVERGIRHAIEVAWERTTPEVQEKYFGNSVSFEKGKPTNSEFISRCAVIVCKCL